MSEEKLTRVRATKVGFYLKLYQPGDVFNYPLGKKFKLGSWMELVNPPKKRATKKKVETPVEE